MSKSQHEGESPLTQNQNNGMSDDPADGQRLTDKPEAVRKTAVEQPPKQDSQDRDRIEELGREGAGAPAEE